MYIKTTINNWKVQKLFDDGNKKLARLPTAVPLGFLVLLRAHCFAGRRASSLYNCGAGNNKTGAGKVISFGC